MPDTVTARAGDTIEVKEAHRFDEARLAVYLGEHLEGFVGPLTVNGPA